MFKFGPAKHYKPFQLTPSPATPQEIIGELRRQGLVEMAESGSPAVFPDEKIKPGTGGAQAALWGERQINLFEGGEK